MARLVNNVNIASRSARTRLAPAGNPYWHAIDAGLHLGYRKGKQAGRWVVRLYDANNHEYLRLTIATADDKGPADGRDVLDFRQAQDAARMIKERHELAATGGKLQYTYSVADAMAEYLEHLTAFGKSAQDAKYRMDAYILPAFGDLECEALTTQQIRNWFAALATQPARLRSKGEQQYRQFDPSDPETLRKRRHSANKVLTILKAGLNRAWQKEKIASDHAWRCVTPFQEVDAPRIRYLSPDEIKRLRKAAPRDLRDLIDGALLSGCRYGELAAMQVMDYHRSSGTLRVVASKPGKSRDVILADQAKTFFCEFTANRDAVELMFRKANGEPWKKSHQGRPLRKACQRAEITPPASFHILRHTHASRLVMAGVPMLIVSKNLGHADTRMTERHYAHLEPSYSADIIRNLASAYGIKREAMPIPMQEES